MKKVFVWKRMPGGIWYLHPNISEGWIVKVPDKGFKVICFYPTDEWKMGMRGVKQKKPLYREDLKSAKELFMVRRYGKSVV